MRSFIFKNEWNSIISTLPVNLQAEAFQAIITFSQTGEIICGDHLKEILEPIFSNIRVQDERRIKRNQRARERRAAMKNTVQKDLQEENSETNQVKKDIPAEITIPEADKSVSKPLKSNPVPPEFQPDKHFKFKSSRAGRFKMKKAGFLPRPFLRKR